METTATESVSKNAPEPIPELKVPAFSVEAEQSFLGGLMMDEDAWDRVAGLVSEADFYLNIHGLIFRSLSQLAVENKPLDQVTVQDRLQKTSDLNQIGGMAYLDQIVRNTPSAANIQTYAEIITERATLRRLATVANKIGESVYKPEGRSAIELVDHAGSLISDIADSGSDGGGPLGISGILNSTVDKISKLFDSDSNLTGVSSGFDDLDEKTAGLQAGDLIIVAGRPSMGKTTFALNVAENVAVKSKKAVLVFSLEMPNESLAMRMLSSMGGIDQTKVRTGKLDDDDWPRLNTAVVLLNDTKLYIDDNGALNPAEMNARARKVARENEGEIALIVVDYLQLMRTSSTGENRATEISEISRALKSLAKELNVPVMALSQLNRSLEQRTDKRPIMSDLRESGAIEQDADVIIFIYRDEVYNEESEQKGIAEIIIGKQRNGPIGKIRLQFEGRYTRFRDLSREYYEG